MAGRIPEDKIDEVLRAADIVEVVGEHVTLKRAGASFKALCPFHDEKTPSFTVNPARQSFKCFGCGKGGSVIGFLMETEKLHFPEAVRQLAERFHVQLPRDGSGDGSGQDREVLYTLNRWACDFYHRYLLEDPAAEPARAYLASRGISPGMTARFLVGAAPESWDALLRRARARKHSLEKLAEAGLLVPRQEGDGYYDRFRNRLLFPIFDVRDRVVGFGARTLGDDTPKYVNTPETPIFSKGKMFYGMNLARGAASKAGELVVVEGYTDVIMCHQHGIENAVATLGTALTRDHVRLVRRFSGKAVALYDGDAAGQKAAERGLDLFVEEEVDLNIGSLPAGQDPCDALTASGPGVVTAAVAAAADLLEFRYRAAVDRHGTSGPTARAAVADEVLETLARSPNPVRRDLQLQWLSARLGVGQAELAGRMQSIGRRLPRTDAGAPAAEAPPAPPVREVAPGRHSAEVQAALELVELLLLDNALIAPARECVDAGELPAGTMREAYLLVLDRHDRNGRVEARDLLTAFEGTAFAAAVAGAVESAAEKSPAAFRFDKLVEAHWRPRRHAREAEAQREQMLTLEAGGDAQAADEAWRAHVEQLRKFHSEKKRNPGS